MKEFLSTISWWNVLALVLIVAVIAVSIFGWGVDPVGVGLAAVAFSILVRGDSSS